MLGFKNLNIFRREKSELNAIVFAKAISIRIKHDHKKN
jgi:hypothetical protein